MSHIRLMLNHLPNVEILAVCVFVFTLIIMTWHPRNAMTPKMQVNSENRLKRIPKTCKEYHVELDGAMILDLENAPDLDLFANHEFTNVVLGGKWAPSKCEDPLSVTIVIPFMDISGDRMRNLKYLIVQLHYILQRHMLKYVIVVSQQNGTEGFMNKGLLMNLGFQHISKDRDTEYSCVVFNDFDLIPTSDRIFYGCDLDNPKHMSSYVNDKIITRNEKTTRGVLSMPSKVFTAVNGFSNRFWGCANEDDDMYERIVSESFTLGRTSPDIGQYLDMGQHKSCNNIAYKPFNNESYKTDGLNSMQEVKVQLLETKLLPLYTLLNFAVEQPGLKKH